jgi:chloramphenicol 3-O phosphotransferase
MHARYRAVKVFLDEGVNVISDDLIYTRAWLIDLLDVFGGYDVWLVGLHVSDEEGARRERERFGRVAGANRGSALAAHTDLEYDFELDSTDVPIPALAAELHEKLQACPRPAAFERLRKRLLT